MDMQTTSVRFNFHSYLSYIFMYIYGVFPQNILTFDIVELPSYTRSIVVIEN